MSDYVAMSWTGFQADFEANSSQVDSDTGARKKTGRMAAIQPSNWEGLRKQARSLENDIDLKLVAFSKLGTNYSTSKPPPGDKQPLLGGDTKLEDLQQELSDLLSKLGQVNEEMSVFGAGSGVGQSAATHHTLQRHTEILQDYNQEFKKTASNIAAILEREDLLSSVQSDISDFRNKENSKRGQAMDSLQREMEHTRNSERLIDEQISIALETRESLVSQREVLKLVQTKLNDLTNKFPMINNLVNKINFRKRRDTIIIGVVIGLCLVFMLWYTFG